jgi:hypothetical protein
MVDGGELMEKLRLAVTGGVAQLLVVRRLRTPIPKNVKRYKKENCDVSCIAAISLRFIHRQHRASLGTRRDRPYFCINISGCLFATHQI